MFVEKEEVKALCLRAAQSVATGSEARVEAVSAAKAYAGKVGRHVCEEAVQLNGAIAIADEYIVGHYLKRIIAIDRLFGDTDYHLERFLASRGSFDESTGSCVGDHSGSAEREAETRQ
jgi:alkylation response protein AidB-like acyl-CoA dehydrogenase